MKSVRFTPALAGATAFALLTGTAAFAQQAGAQQAQQQEQPAQPAQGAQQPAQQTQQQPAQGGQQPAQQQDAQANAQMLASAEQVLQQLEQARQALQNGDAQQARETLEQANQTLLDTATNSTEDGVSQLQTPMQQAITAVDQQDMEAAMAALDDMTMALEEMRASAQQGGQTLTSGQGSGQTTSSTGASVTVMEVTTGQSGQQGSAQMPAQGGQIDQQALWDAQDALDLARQEVEAALRAVEEAAAVLGQVQPGMAGQPRTTDEQGAGQVQTMTGQQPQETVTAGQQPPRLSAEESYRLLGTGDRAIGEAADMAAMTVADLEDRNVVTFEGENIGEIDQLVSNGGQVYAIIEHGGFLGIGESKVAIPADRLGMRGEDIVLLGLTQEQLERMPEYDFAAGQEMGQEDPIEIGRYE